MVKVTKCKPKLECDWGGSPSVCCISCDKFESCLRACKNAEDFYIFGKGCKEMYMEREE